MSSITRHRTIDDLLDVKAVLRNSSLVRKWGPAIGTDWTRIRIGLRWACTDSGGNLSDAPKLRVGICSGTTNPWHNDATIPTTNFVGIRSQIDWARSTGPVKYQMAATGSTVTGLRVTKRVGTTETDDSSLIAGNTYIGATPETGFRTLLIFEVTKGSPNFNFKLLRRSATTEIDETKQSLLDTIGLSVLSKDGYAMATERNFATDESAGAFDSVNVAWDRVAAEIELSDVVVARME